MKPAAINPIQVITIDIAATIIIEFVDKAINIIVIMHRPAINNRIIFCNCL